MPSVTERITAPNGDVSIEPLGERLELRVGGSTIVDTEDAVRLLETAHKPVYYLPVRDVRRGVLQASSTTSHCPRKGDASYYDVVVGERRIADAAWYYPDPSFPGALDLSEYLAFYFGKVDEWLQDGRPIDAPTES